MKGGEGEGDEYKERGGSKEEKKRDEVGYPCCLNSVGGDVDVHINNFLPKSKLVCVYYLVHMFCLLAHTLLFPSSLILALVLPASRSFARSLWLPVCLS